MSAVHKSNGKGNGKSNGSKWDLPGMVAVE